jgi:F-type H+-transporting ATPase subunit delta
VQNLVGLLFDKGREEVLLGLGDAFHALELEAAGQVEGVVESARPLAKSEMDLVATQLGPQFGKQLLLTNKIVPDLVGGARVIAQNRMIDYSVQGRLDALRRRLMDAPLPAAQT